LDDTRSVDALDVEVAIVAALVDPGDEGPASSV